MLSRAHSVQDATLAAFLRAQPPRTVPRAIRRAAFRQSGNGFLIFFGAIFLAMGSVFMVVMFPWRIDRDVRLHLAATTFANGTISAVAPTNLTINRRRVYRYAFEFPIRGAYLQSGECFTTGQSFGLRETVRVEYRIDDPTLACVVGARLTQGGAGVMMVALFPLAGVAVLGFAVVSRRRTRRLLEQGSVTEATVLSYAPTNMRVNNRPVHKVELRLEGIGQTVTVRRSDKAVVALLEERRVGGVVSVLFDPQRPRRLVIVEAWRI